MAELPFLKLWTADYLEDTRDLSTEEHGAYLLLMMSAWSRPNTNLPDDDKKLARLAGLSEERWLEIRANVMAYWKLDNRSKTWTQKRLLEEKEEARAYAKKQQSNAKARWEKEKRGSTGSATGEPREDVGMSTGTTSGNPHHSHSHSHSQNPSPSPPSRVEPPRTTDDGRFEKLDKALASLPGIAGHPCAVAPSIAPIWQLVQDGCDIDLDVIPTITEHLKRAPPGSIRQWSYFAPGIRQARDTRKAAAATASSTAAAVWESRLELARKMTQWDLANWGPIPNTPGCIVPPALLEPTGGKNWTIWEPGK